MDEIQVVKKLCCVISDIERQIIVEAPPSNHNKPMVIRRLQAPASHELCLACLILDTLQTGC